MGCFYGWLACGGGAVAWALLEINVLYHDDCSHISLCEHFLLSPNQTRNPFYLFYFIFRPSLLSLSFPLTRDQMNLSFFPVFWLTGYNLHMYFVLLYATYIRHHHHLSSSIMSYFRELVSRGERKKKGSTSTCMYCTQSFVGQAYVCTFMYQV